MRPVIRKLLFSAGAVTAAIYIFVLTATGDFARAGAPERHLEPIETLRAQILQARPGRAVTSVDVTESSDLFEVRYADGQTELVTRDGRFFVRGDLVSAASGENLTETRKEASRAKILGTIPHSALIHFPANDAKYHVYVLTDVECGYCRKFHQQIGLYTGFGISVDYVLYARNGAKSPVAQQHAAILCSRDPAQALTSAKAGNKLSEPSCEAPIATLQDIGRRLGMYGTPGIFADNGAQLGGYLAPAELAVRLEQESRRRGPVASAHGAP